MREVKITVDIDAQGNSKVEAHNFPNNACLKETASLEEAMGKLVTRDAKPEMHIPDAKAAVGIKAG
jgi:hypothetical protein